MPVNDDGDEDYTSYFIGNTISLDFCIVDLDQENSICPAPISKTVIHSRVANSMNQTHLFGGESLMSNSLMKSPLTGLSSIRQSINQFRPGVLHASENTHPRIAIDSRFIQS